MKTTFCRCCFKFLIPSEKQIKVTGNILTTFEDLTSQQVQSHDLTPTFCEPCSSQIMNFSDFKRITLVKQEKFHKLLQANEICKLHEVSEMNYGKDQHETPKTAIVHHEVESLPVAQVKPKPSRQAKEQLSPLKGPKMPSKYPNNCTFANGRYNCSNCSYSTLSPSSFNVHFFKLHVDLRNHICHVCGNVFASPLSLQLHIMRIHEQDPKFRCDLCEKKFYVKNELR